VTGYVRLGFCNLDGPSNSIVDAFPERDMKHLEGRKSNLNEGVVTEVQLRQINEVG